MEVNETCGTCRHGFDPKEPGVTVAHCGKCGDPLCGEHMKQCPFCGRINCASCGDRCEECGRWFRKEHLKRNWAYERNECPRCYGLWDCGLRPEKPIDPTWTAWTIAQTAALLSPYVEVSGGSSSTVTLHLAGLHGKDDCLLLVNAAGSDTITTNLAFTGGNWYHWGPYDCGLIGTDADAAEYLDSATADKTSLLGVIATTQDEGIRLATSYRQVGDPHYHLRFAA